MLKLKVLVASAVAAVLIIGFAAPASAADNVDNYFTCVKEWGGSQAWCCRKYGGVWVERWRLDDAKWTYLEYCQIDEKTRIYHDPGSPEPEPPSQPTSDTNGGARRHGEPRLSDYSSGYLTKGPARVHACRTSG